MRYPAPTNPASYFANLALHTRAYGSCYIHAAARTMEGMSWDGITLDGINYQWSSYGRSLQGGGHKYKVHATREGKPVPSKELSAI